MVEKYSEGGSYKKKFGVSTQHYSFAVKAFVDMVQKFDVSEYEFAIRETKTADVISDVSAMKSEVGVLYLSDFNRKALLKLLHSANLEFHHLIDCQAYVYLWKNHPLANEKSISYSQLAKYPCLSFEQGDKSSFYLSEEILSTNEYSRTVKASDRATMLNLMVGLNGYTLCSGIICESECSRLFKRYMNVSLFTFLQEYRVERSLEFLLSSDDSIMEVAQKSGFTDSNYYAKVIRFKNASSAVMELKNGGADAVLIDNIMAEIYCKQNSDLQYESVPSTAEDTVFCIQKGNTEIAQIINDGLAKVKNSGEYDDLYQKYFVDTLENSEDVTDVAATEGVLGL